MNDLKASQELLKTIQLGVIAIQVIFVCVSVKTFTENWDSKRQLVGTLFREYGQNYIFFMNKAFSICLKNRDGDFSLAMTFRGHFFFKMDKF